MNMRYDPFEALFDFQRALNLARERLVARRNRWNGRIPAH